MSPHLSDFPLLRGAVELRQQQDALVKIDILKREMFFLTRPSDEMIEGFLEEQTSCKFSYREVGATARTPPPSYTVDHNRIKLGEGEIIFERAREAIQSWDMFDLSWVYLVDRDTPIERNASVAVLAYHFGFWSLNGCRVVYRIDSDGDVKRFGFAYGTLPDHAERGEERFLIEFNRIDNSVWYDILAFSKPNHPFSMIGYPIVRLLQKRFASDSKKAMLHAVSD